MITQDQIRLKKMTKCAECDFYDPSAFPEYRGKLAVCRNPKHADIGCGKIGCYTVADRSCFGRDGVSYADQ